MEITKSKWFKIYVCIECNKQLEYQDKRHNKGICPYCGHNSKLINCETSDIVLREICYNHPWWKKLLGLFQGIDLSERIEYEGKDETAKEWLKTNKI